MSEARDWRTGSAYDYIDELTPSELAWEFLRRNPDYRRSYQELRAAGQLSPDMAGEFARRWGLRFRSRPARDRSCPIDLLDPAGGSRRDHSGRRPCAV